MSDDTKKYTDRIKAKAEKLYLAEYGERGGQWRLVQDKEFWYEKAGGASHDHDDHDHHHDGDHDHDHHDHDKS